MHELTLAQNTLEILEQQARLNGARRVTGVWLAIGAFSCVEAESLHFCFDMVCRGTAAEGCELHLEQQPALAWCARCARQVTLPHAPLLVCPLCGGHQLQTDAHDHIQIKRLEVA
ncbi:hydrogenase maturation nickel metallochaperone HypA [Acerihabitans arboris]|uniref:Hydrogenase maturation factor HypA n=1 Tax=Acerihabitans arboris TaxID=2691583 RepID=A0A845SG72_9GAMM|nr:hydrogenase maturation nickel metallochaperone HypA [Acerihabitans arboris]NDL64063.1 hydrogenase maturation nickel metallochaperone HypA [Acerihabitans arboris]